MDDNVRTLNQGQALALRDFEFTTGPLARRTANESTAL